MQEVTLRDFLRSYKKLLPFPAEGLKVICRDDQDFYISYKKPNSTEDLRKIAQFIVQEMREAQSSSQRWEAVEPLANPVTPSPAPTGYLCEAKLLMPWESTCNNKAEPFLVANTEDGLPMGPSDWKTIHLCPIHKGVVESMGGFEIETP